MREYVRIQTAVLLRRFAFQLNRAARSGDEDSIHDLRVAIRRLSRCLRAFSDFYPDHSTKKIRHELSALMHAAGEVRDRDIAMELLADAKVPRSAAIVKRFTTERREAEHALQAEIRRWSHRGFSRKWRSRLNLER